MNKSRYNVVVDSVDGEHLLYNTANGAFATLDAVAFAAYEAGEPDANGVLAQAGFLTQASPAEELEAQRAQFEAARADTSTFMLVVAPTYACNYRCPYCYELGHNSIKGIMDDEVQDAVFDFVCERYDAAPFEHFVVEWYGGDPSLALDVVEALSERFIAWADAHGVDYDAMILTNCNLIDQKAVDMLKRVRVSGVYITIDGPEGIHNRRRVAANGSNSYERNIEAARLFVEAGIHVSAIMNTDKVSWPYYADLREQLAEEVGIELTAGKLNDYGHFFGTRDFKKPDFDLFTHVEFARLEHDARRAEGNFTASTLRSMLRPVPRFCNGQRHNYYVVDTIGDVYKCDGYMGEKDHVRFNIFDDAPADELRSVTFDATHDGKCSECELLPLCLGSCIWERECTGMPCHPLKTTMSDYLEDYRSCFGEVGGGVTLLTQPFTPEEIATA